MILDKIYISSTEPIVTNVLWAKPLDGGAFSLYAFLSGKWGLLKLMRDNGTPYPDDDTPGGSADNCYTKEEIDNKLADILGLDAEGIAELKALIEDDDALTGLLGELKDGVKSVEVFHYLQGSHKPLPVGKYNYTISGLINIPKCVYNEGNYLIFRYAEDLTTHFFHYLVFEEKTVDEVTGYFCVHSYSPSSEPPAWVEDAFGYTRSETNNLLNGKVDKEQGKGLSSNDYTTEEKNKVANIPTALSQLTDDTTHRTVSDTEKNTWNNKGTISGITMNGVSKGTSGVVNLGNVLTSITTNVTNGGLSAVTSGGVYTALQDYEKKLTFVTKPESSVSAANNCYYILPSVYNSYTFTLPTSDVTNGCTICFQFTTGSNFTGITWVNGTRVFMKDFNIQSSKTYEVVALYVNGKWLITATEFE